MTQYYRITREKYASDLSGNGAKLYGGRWNRPGVAALYLSQARSLALLELIVHFSSAAAMKMNYVFITLDIPDDTIFSVNEQIDKSELLQFNSEKLWSLTDKYFFEENHFAIKVPSIIIPEEFNVILNPSHKLMSQIMIKNIQPALLDARLLNNW